MTYYHTETLNVFVAANLFEKKKVQINIYMLVPNSAINSDYQLTRKNFFSFNISIKSKIFARIVNGTTTFRNDVLFFLFKLAEATDHISTDPVMKLRMVVGKVFPKLILFYYFTFIRQRFILDMVYKLQPAISNGSLRFAVLQSTITQKRPNHQA